jgi:hypothetical protein
MDGLKYLNIDIPEDARTFIREAVSGVTEMLEGGGKLTHLHLADGSVKDIGELDDSEACQYARELLPLYKAKYPDLVKEEHEQ